MEEEWQYLHFIPCQVSSSSGKGGVEKATEKRGEIENEEKGDRWVHTDIGEVAEGKESIVD